MVARTPPKQQRKKMAIVTPHLSPTLLRETVKKVDKCMARLQELQYTVTGGAKVVSGVSSSPRRSYHRTSVPSFKQDTLRSRNANPRPSPPGKLPPVATEDWRRMSLPAMLLGETMGELVNATQFARNIVQAAAAAASRTRPNKTRKTSGDPKTPPLKRKPMHNMNLEDTWQTMHARRKREKQTAWVGPGISPRAKSKISFKVSSSVYSPYKECDKENCKYVVAANRVSPRNRPWSRKTVLFPNPLFNSSLSLSPTREKVTMIARSRQQTPHKFLIKSPPLKSPTREKVTMIARSRQQTPHKFLIKSPPLKSPKPKMRRSSLSPSRLANRIMTFSPLKGRKYDEKTMMEIEKSRQMAHKFLIQGKMKSAVVAVSANSPRRAAAGMSKKLSPPPPAKASGAAAKPRRSFSPSRFANRIVLSPMKLRSSSLQKNGGSGKN